VQYRVLPDSQEGYGSVLTEKLVETEGDLMFEL
jgi:hypothetical protein